MARIITDYLEENIKIRAEKTIFEDDSDSVTVIRFRELSRCVATEIIKAHCFRKPIVVYMEKSIHCLAAFIGVAYSGNFYTPIDIDMPKQRVDNILEILNPAIIVTSRKTNESAKLLQTDAIRIVYEDAIAKGSNDELINEVTDSIIDTDPLYVLFTSGSTGVPKGVVVSHKNVISYTDWVTDAFDIDIDTVFGNQTPFYFSMSVLEIYSTIKMCALMYIIPKKLFSFPVRLLEYLCERRINTIYWVPSALCLVANLNALGSRDISCLKRVLFAGEVMPAKQLNMWIRHLPWALFANLFGPTEATDISNYYIVSRQLSDTEPVPIGNACKNTDVFILDENDNAVDEMNVIGELCIRGSIIAYGYYNNPQKTAEVFVSNPLNNAYPEIIYRTGDLVHINGFGELIYDGRKDYQIKHMGHRIELGEIETAVSSVEGVSQNICTYDSDKKRIVLYYSGTVDNGGLTKYIRDLLPSCHQIN